jgi:hypothetical protein
MDWLAKPELIYYGVWGPLHTYLIGAVLFLWKDPVYAPVVLSSIFSVATAIPLYLFVKREWGETSGFFVACMYLAYPVAIRYGLVAMSETPYIFFIALSMLFLSFAKDEKESWKYGAMAGLSLTVAGSLRYEAWGLAPILGLLLWKKWRPLAAFLFTSALFPVFWMTGNYLQFGDPLYSLNWSTNWNLVISAANKDVIFMDYIFRLLFFPRALFFGLTPIAFIVCSIGMVLVLRKRSRQWGWSIPFLVLFLALTLNAVNGNLSLQARYSLSLAIFMLPFAAEWFEHSKPNRHRLLLSILTIASMIPLSYLRYVIPWPYDFPNPIPKQVSAIPRLGNSSTERILDFAREQEQLHPTGLLLDFFNWEETYYVAVKSYKDPSSIFIMPGEVNEKVVPNALNTFIEKNPKGILLLSQNSRFMQVEKSVLGEVLHFTDLEKTLLVEPLGEVEGITFYSYSVTK